MPSRFRAKNPNRLRAPLAAGICLALAIGCSSTDNQPGGGAGQPGSGGTQAVAGKGGSSSGGGGSSGITGSGGSSGITGSGGSSGITGSGGSSGTSASSGGAGGGGQPGNAGTSGSSFTLGGRAGAAGSGAGGERSGGAGGVVSMGGRAGSGGTSAGASPGGRAGMGGRGSGGNGAGGTAMAGSGGSGGDFQPCPTSDPCKILPLGDSITFGIQYEGAWRVELFHDALKDNKKITFVGSQMNGPGTVDGTMFPKSHEGHSGYTIDQMKPFAMTTDVPYMPNMILLHIGTNDTYGNSPSGAPMRLAALADLILATYPNSLLVVAKIVPYPSQAANVKLINDSIPDMVQQRAMQGKHIAMTDCFTGFMTASMLSSDSIHPNQTGYNFMGDQFYSVIKSYLH